MRQRPPKSVVLVHVEYLAARCLLGLVRVLPLRLALGLAGALGELVFLLDWPHRRRAVENLLHTGVATSRKAAVRLARASFRHLARVPVEVLKIVPRLSRENLAAWVSLRGPPAVVQRFLRPGGEQAIFAIAHLGNWELGGLAYGLLTGRRTVVIMRTLDNPKLDALIRDARGRHGNRLCAKAGAMKALLAALRAGDGVALVVDQHAGGGKGIDTLFFGHPVRSHASPAALHLHTGVPILPIVCLRRAQPPRFELVVAEPVCVRPGPDREADIRRTVQAYTAALEGLIRQAPEQWLWAHRRWRAPSAAGVGTAEGLVHA